MTDAQIDALAQKIAEEVAGDTWARTWDMTTNVARILREHLTALDPDTVTCPIVRRPTTSVSTLVVPEDGLYAKRFRNGVHSISNTIYGTGEHLLDSIAAIRRIDTDAPTTWIERAETQEPAAWTATDVPDVESVMLCLNGKVSGWVYHRNIERSFVATQANEKQATHLLILPERLP